MQDLKAMSATAKVWKAWTKWEIDGTIQSDVLSEQLFPNEDGFCCYWTASAEWRQCSKIRPSRMMRFVLATWKDWILQKDLNKCVITDTCCTWCSVPFRNKTRCWFEKKKKVSVWTHRESGSIVQRETCDVEPDFGNKKRSFLLPEQSDTLWFGKRHMIPTLTTGCCFSEVQIKIFFLCWKWQSNSRHRQ